MARRRARRRLHVLRDARALVRAVPASETGSAMSFNQVLRTIGFSTGSALSVTVLEAHTPAAPACPPTPATRPAPWSAAPWSTGCSPSPPLLRPGRGRRAPGRCQRASVPAPLPEPAAVPRDRPAPPRRRPQPRAAARRRRARCSPSAATTAPPCATSASAPASTPPWSPATSAARPACTSPACTRSSATPARRPAGARPGGGAAAARRRPRAPGRSCRSAVRRTRTRPCRSPPPRELHARLVAPLRHRLGRRPTPTCWPRPRRPPSSGWRWAGRRVRCRPWPPPTPQSWPPCCGGCWPA